MDEITILLQLFATFFMIGVFTFGGGYAMLSMIQSEVVMRHAWLSESEFTNIVAISQSTPGPIGINCATYTGYEVLNDVSPVMGFVGSFVATLALVLPSFIIVLALVKVYKKFLGHRYFDAVMSGLRPAVVGLIGAAAVILVVNIGWNGCTPHFSIIEDNFPDWKSWVLFGAALIASLKFKVGPITIICAGAVAGILLY
ncbi:MAG: chromate transporter [Bacteroidales bacterium]|nr:chromate transporter [Bacteroidales bacterium]